MKTKQQIFTQVKNHLLSQMKKSVNYEGCAYRSPEGLSCAVGCLISDEAYNSNIEGISTSRAHSSRLGEVLKKSDIPTDSDTLALLQELQDLHDNLPTLEWAEALKIVAEENGLEY